MERKDIEKASKDYQNTLPYCDDRKVRGYFVGAKDGFIKGAEWRINSVWHDPEEIPDIVKLLLVEHEDGHCGMSILYTKKASREGWKRWAYVKDLLPIKDDEK